MSPRPRSPAYVAGGRSRRVVLGLAGTELRMASRAIHAGLSQPIRRSMAATHRARLQAITARRSSREPGPRIASASASACSAAAATSASAAQYSSAARSGVTAPPRPWPRSRRTGPGAWRRARCPLPWRRTWRAVVPNLASGSRRAVAVLGDRSQLSDRRIRRALSSPTDRRIWRALGWVAGTRRGTRNLMLWPVVVNTTRPSPPRPTTSRISYPTRARSVRVREMARLLIPVR